MQPNPKKAIGNQPFFEQQAVYIVPLFFLTLGFYEHYWHFRNWKRIRTISGDNTISPLLRGIFFPFFILSLTSIIRGAADNHGQKRGVSSTLFAIIYTVAAFVPVADIRFLGIDGDYSFAIANATSLFLLCLLQNKTSSINRAGCPHEIRKANIVEVQTVNLSANARTVELARSDKAHQEFILPHRATIEFSTVALVVAVCLSVALQDGQKFISKTSVLDIFTFASSAQTEVLELYALTGKWPEQDLNYLSNDYGSRITGNLASSTEGRIRFELKDFPPFQNGDVVEMKPEFSGNEGPMPIIRWICTGMLNSAEERRLSLDDYLPSVCRD